MAEIEDAIERADREAFTRQPPKTLKARINFLMKQLKTTKAVAQEIGISQRSVERYRKGERKHPPQAIAERIDAAVRQRWQPQVRRRRQRQAATTGGITVETRARFGYTAPVGTTDDGRFRRLTVHLPRPTHNACSTPAPQAPATSRCARSSPKDSKKSTSKTAEAVPQDSPTSPSTTSTTSTSTTNLQTRRGPGTCSLKPRCLNAQARHRRMNNRTAPLAPTQIPTTNTKQQAQQPGHRRPVNGDCPAQEHSVCDPWDSAGKGRRQARSCTYG